MNLEPEPLGWAIPLQDVLPAGASDRSGSPVRTPPPSPDDSPDLFRFRDSDEPPYLGFVPRLRSA